MKLELGSMKVISNMVSLNIQELIPHHKVLSSIVHLRNMMSVAQIMELRWLNQHIEDNPPEEEELNQVHEE